MHCFKGSSSLSLIRRLGRPAILTLHDETDKDFYAVLTGFASHGATLRAGEVSQTVPLAALEKVWRGDFATLWRAPPGYVSAIADGASGPVANWLVVQLAKLNGEPPAGKPPGDAR